MRNFARLTNAANNIEARRDWLKQVDRAWKMGKNELIYSIARQCHISDITEVGWRKLDKATAALRQALDALAVPGGTTTPHHAAPTVRTAGETGQVSQD